MDWVEDAEQRCLNGGEVLKLVDNKANVMNYRNLLGCKTLDEALGPHNALILLYESKKDFGHWTLVFRSPDGTIEHFDSYGYMPDQELIFVPKKFKKVYYNKIPHLTLLLYNSNEPVRFSQYKLQGEDVNTCGRWVAMRLLLKHLTEDEFKKLMTDKRMGNDKLVTIATELMLRK